MLAWQRWGYCLWPYLFTPDKLTSMRGLAFLLSVLSLCALAADQSQKTKKLPDVQVLEAKARRIEDKVSVDGKVRVNSEKPLRGLVLVFDFLDHDNSILTSEKDQVSEDALASGDTPAFHAETLNPPGSIKFKLRAFDGSEKELRIGNGGPFIIE
ncbi:conserved exported hypothetical protein [Candidatus Sulfopaludibacter sp. SbA3]|nr:conserved exported hypothetical protein [Candidatus Sulfopaludibacter sp. SbA3]